MLSHTKSSSDIFMSIKPEHMRNIASGAKNHEYRGYLLPSSVRRIWFYTTAPVKRLEYVARISAGKPPGTVPNDGGIGNADFNDGKKKIQVRIRNYFSMDVEGAHQLGEGDVNAYPERSTPKILLGAIYSSKEPSTGRTAPVDSEHVGETPSRAEGHSPDEGFGQLIFGNTNKGVMTCN
ncbi:hypothetical protein N7476_005055 [Penicillium atrosanguineum]|uniref:Uncharacterized protein n=1 Tax=Penicillium atrosanguineum TaxID=1132637 RepID=A0A9W9Q0H8_9EURO|nr:hypothetical protein N7476_005055 [Penicillium atrosanguineum]